MTRAVTCGALVCVLALIQSSGAPVTAQRRPEGPKTATAGQLLISEFRVRGPLGANDEFIEIYNASGSPHTVSAASGTGYGIAASDGVTRCSIPNGVVIPNHGHFLCVNSIGYSLASYPAGPGPGAVGDATYATNINDNAGIALFNNNSGGGSYSLANRLDAVGSTAEVNAIYKEGAGYPQLNSVIESSSVQYSFFRKWVGMCGESTCGGLGVLAAPAASSALVDTNNNATDLQFGDPNGTSAGGGQHLAAPGPENTTSPIMLDGSSQLLYQKASGCSPRDGAPNTVHDPTSDPANNANFGTLDLRTGWKNTTGAGITRLRFRIVDISTFPSAVAYADLRPRSAPSASITVDGYPCGTGTSTVTAQATVLESPPSQPNGGGFNSTLTVPSVTAGTPLNNGSSITVRFLLGIQQNGITRFCVIPETIPASPGDPYCYISTGGSVPTTRYPGDFDNDGTAEMPLYNSATGQWKILKSSSAFAAESVISWGGAGYKAVPGDYDGDGRYDAAVYNPSTLTWSVLTSSSNFTRSFNMVYGAVGCDPVPADYDGDKTTDFSLACPGQGVWGFAPSSQNFSSSVVAAAEDPQLTPIGGYDFDGDQRADMVSYRERTGEWYVITSTSNYTSFTVTSWGGRGYTAVAGDYDGDAKPDYGLYQRSTGQWSILKSVGGYTSVLGKSWGGPGYLPVPADFDGDHRLEIAVYRPATTTWMALKSSTAFTTVLTAVYGTAGETPISTAVVPRTSRENDAGDFDGDAISDITVYNTTSGVWSTLRSGTLFTAAFNRGWGGTGYTPVPGDYDGDGKGDLGLYQPSTGQWLVLKSDAGFTTMYSFSAGGSGYVPVPGDYDGDGRTDMVVYNTTTGIWFGRKSASDFTTVLSVSWGGTGYTATPGDFDADGKLDLGIYQGSTGNWLILKSSSGYTTTITRGFGGAGYLPVQADFDGDAITDFAVYQTATGVWTMLKSSTENTVGFTVAYGGAAYTPVAGDWDGDGRADVGVYDAAGNWSILLSNGNFTTSLGKSWGGAGYVPVPIFP